MLGVIILLYSALDTSLLEFVAHIVYFFRYIGIIYILNQLNV